MAFNYIQTFFVNSTSLGNAAETSISSIDLFFKTKPSRTNNSSAVYNPGVTVYLCPATISDVGPGTLLYGTLKKNEYDDIPISSDASVKTTFTFDHPVTLQTDRYYGIVVSFDDPAYDLWYIKQGDKLVGSSIIAASSSFNNGQVYENSNSTVNPKADMDLKFRINVAKYSASSTVIKLLTDDYEFFTVSNLTSSFSGGEAVYKQVANATGSVVANSSSTLLVGAGTEYEAEIPVDELIVITDGSTVNTDIRKVISVNSNTSLVLDVAPSFDVSNAVIKVSPIGYVYYTDYINNKIFLSGSTANSTLKFGPSDVLLGEISGSNATIASVDTFSVDTFYPELMTTNPAGSSIDARYLFAYSNGSAYLSNSASFATIDQSIANEVKGYDAILVSKSLEVDNAGTLYKGKSGILDITLNIDANSFNGYESPSVYSQKIDILSFQNKINNNATGEHTDSGGALSKYISKKIVLANNAFAEDVLSYITAYRPAGTDIKVYARLHNSLDIDAFDDKYWTELSVLSNKSLYSSTTNSGDYIEYSYGLPQYPPSQSTLQGVFTSQLSNNVILSSNDQSGAIAANDLVKIYDPLFAETNHQIAVVSAVNSTSFTIGDVIGSSDVVGAGLKVDKLMLNQTAFRNIQNDNVARYYSSSLVEFDNYDSFAIKIVMLSNNSFIVPAIEDVRSIAVSA